MSQGFSKVNFFPFEQALSSDVNRIQALQSREVQDRLMISGAADSDVFNGLPSYQSGATGSDNLISEVADRPPGVVLIDDGGPFQADITAGQAYRFVGAATADDSSYALYRWDQTTLTFANPHGSLPRLDVVVARPGSQAADPLLRNILLDPVARTVAQQTINKTQNPLATLAIVQGTPNATPSANYTDPLIAVDGIVLYEVLVPPAVSGALNFTFTPQLARRAEFPLCATSGILHGCVPTWVVGGEEASVTSIPALAANTHTPFHRVVINGRVFTLGLPSSLATIPVESYNDLSNNPFGSAAPSGHDQPFYIYLAGGVPCRVGPRVSGASQFGSPFVMVFSATPPDNGAHPNGSFTISLKTNGSNTSIGAANALFIGCGWKVRNTTLSKALVMDGDWAYAKSTTVNQFGGAGGSPSFAEQAPAIATSPAATLISFLSRPPAALCTMAEVTFAAVKTASTVPTVLSFIGHSGFDPSPPEYFRAVLTAVDPNKPSMGRMRIAINDGPTDVRIAAVVAGQEGNFQYLCAPYGYKLRIPRLGGSL